MCDSEMSLCSLLYLETPTMERTDRESSEECPRHRTFRPKLLTFLGGGPHPFDQAVIPVGYYPALPIFWTLYGYRLKTGGDLYTSTPYNANWALYFLCTGRLHFTDRAHVSHQTLIRVLRPLPMRALTHRHHLKIQNAHLSFPRVNLILARGRSSVRPETRTHSELWCESGPV